MLVTFYCDAFANITYLGDIAAKLLQYMQYGVSIPGAIVAADVPFALANLRTAISQEMQNQPVDKEISTPQIPIDKRALPLINLLTAAIAAHCDVMWDRFSAKHP